MKMKALHKQAKPSLSLTLYSEVKYARNES